MAAGEHRLADVAGLAPDEALEAVADAFIACSSAVAEMLAPGGSAFVPGGGSVGHLDAPLMTLAAQDHHVAGAGLLDGGRDRRLVLHDEHDGFARRCGGRH